MRKCEECNYKNTCSEKRKSRSKCEDFFEKPRGGIYPGGTPPFYLCDICKYGSKEYLCLEDNLMNRKGFKTKPESVKEILWVEKHGLECNVEHCDHFKENISTTVS